MYTQDQVMEFVNLYLDKYEMTTFPSARLGSVSAFSVADIETALEQLTDRVQVEKYISCPRCSADVSTNIKLVVHENGVIMCVCGEHVHPEPNTQKRYIKLA